MIQSLLIANRGEIARRVIRTARAMDIRTIAVHSDVDADMPFVREADEAVCIGAAPARESYLDQSKILAAAKQTGAQAIHPGYGFLSENAEFAEAVIAAGLVWVGAPPAAIRAMGLKDAAKALMAKAGVPVTPGYLGEDQDPERLQAEADGIGYPVLIKAVAGGGGKGMRRVERSEDFADALASCRREAASAFGDDRVLIEKYVLNPRHIEVQIFGDAHGNVVHLFERDCSLQRRHQKVIEEAPAPGMDETTREAICAAAVKAAKAVDYVGAGTIEFIADASEGLRADRIWFMEMNTRLQVEHPVTEEITGQDLVEWQLRVASGEPLPRQQHELAIDGWAMEARLYAEDPAKGFLPSIGRLDHLFLPDHMARVESGVEQGNRVSPYYDPMIAKLVTHGASRDEARRALVDAANDSVVWPVRTNATFLARLAEDEAFASAMIDTGYIERNLDRLLPESSANEVVLRAGAVACVYAALDGKMPHQVGKGLYRRREIAAPWNSLFGFRCNAEPDRRVVLVVDGERREITLDRSSLEEHTELQAWVEGCGATILAGQHSQVHAFTLSASANADSGGIAGDGSLRAPMPGRIVSVDIAEGDAVTAGQKLVVIEAMKMEQGLIAPFDGVVAELMAVAGAQVSEGALLARIEKPQA